MPPETVTRSARAPVAKRKPENTEIPELHNRIALRAYQIYEESGRVPGRDLENWLRAEQEALTDRLDADLG